MVFYIITVFNAFVYKCKHLAVKRIYPAFKQVNTALAESLYEKGDDDYEILSLLSRSQLKLEPGGAHEIAFVPPLSDNAAQSCTPTVPKGSGYSRIHRDGMEFTAWVCGNITVDG